MTNTSSPSGLPRGLVVVLGSAIAGAALIGTAGAYWSAPGTGSGSGGTSPIAISATVSGITGLYPGASVPATVVLRNSSATAPVTIVSLAQSAATTLQGAGKGACTPTVVSFTVGTLPPGQLNPGQSANATGSVTMTAAAADGCQGATFSIPLTASGRTP